MSKITILKTLKDGDFLHILSTVADDIKSLNEEQKQIYIKGFMFGRSGAVEITDQEMESASKLLDESSIISRDKEIGFMNCWNYIKSRINQ